MDLNLMKYLYVIIISLATFIGNAQEKNIKSSNESYEKYAFIKAQQMYLEIVNDGFESKELFQKLGDTYYFNNDYKNAHKWYSRLFKYDTTAISKAYYFRYIQSLKAVKKYDEASKLMTAYLSLKEDGIVISSSATDANYLKKIELQSGRYKIRNEEMNSSAQDFGTSYYLGNKHVVFASSKDSTGVVRRRHEWNNRPFLNLYIADVDSTNGRLSSSRKFGNGDKKLNTKFHESNAVFTKDGQTVYYTSNNYLNKEFKKSGDDVNKLKIFRAFKSLTGWTDIEELSINSDEWSTAHPALNEQENRLYFASDRPGSMLDLDGKRSSDIWYVDIDKNAALSLPVNLKAVNTSGKELFPFISSKADLYFSSTGHAGLGGLDVFIVPLENALQEEQAMVTNLGKPINSSYDDFCFIINDVTKTGYFSSNRKEGKGLDDIYSFKQLKELACQDIITGIVTDVTTGELLPGAQVALLDKDNVLIESIEVVGDAVYTFTVDCKTTYVLQARKETYATTEAVITTPNRIATLALPLQLSKSIDERMQTVQVGDDLNEVLDLTTIYFDFDKDNIRPDAQVELQKILKYMNAYPTISMDIKSHTDSRAPDDYNVQLSDRRAQSTRAYLISKGIASSRLTANGYGESQLLNNCSNGVTCTKEQHQLNRRSEFIVVKK